LDVKNIQSSFLLHLLAWIVSLGQNPKCSLQLSCFSRYSLLINR